MAHARAFFELLEARFGRLADLVEPAARRRVLASSRHLQPNHLASLLRHEAGTCSHAYL